MKLTSTQVKNKSNVTGASITDALNTLSTSLGDGSGDMLKSLYDTNNNGKVDVAEVADTVPWLGISDKPTLFTPQVHSHTVGEVTNLQTELNGKASITHIHAISDVTDLSAELAAKQGTLVSGTNIKTINGSSLLGSGDLTITGGGGGSGDVAGPASSVDNNIAVFDGTTGKVIKDGGAVISSLATTTQLETKQDTLVSGTSIKTINNTSLLGSGDVSVQPTLVSGTNIKTVNGTSLLGSGDIVISGGAGLVLEEVNTASVTAVVGKNYALVYNGDVTVTAPASLSVGNIWGVMVCNGRSTNTIAWNGHKHENISDTTMVLGDKSLVVEIEYVNATFGNKVKIL